MIPVSSGYIRKLENEIENPVKRLNELKKEKNAIIPAHYYQRDEVKFVADFIGDSLELSRKSKETNADIILFAGVNFMAETAKILNPSKKVLVPDLDAGCSLADSITGADVRRLKKQYPDAAVVSYVNTTAEVKAESDICVTSANYIKIVESFPNDQIIFIPDKYLAQNLATKTNKKIIDWEGECIVHKSFTEDQIKLYREVNPEIEVLVHVECPSKVVKHADYSGSTSGMKRYIKDSTAKDFMILTECGMVSTLEKEFPDRTFSTPCSVCPYMKKNTLDGLIWSLENEQHEIKIPENIRIKAYNALEKMLQYS